LTVDIEPIDHKEMIMHDVNIEENKDKMSVLALQSSHDQVNTISLIEDTP